MAATAMIAGAGMSALGAIQQGQTANQTAQQQAFTDQMNAIQSRTQADYNEQKSRLQANMTMGTAQANYGASGVTLSGSPTDVLKASIARSEQDALLIKQRGDIMAQGYNNQASFASRMGQSAVTGSYLGAAASALNGIGAYGRYYGGGSTTINNYGGGSSSGFYLPQLGSSAGYAP